MKRTKEWTKNESLGLAWYGVRECYWSTAVKSCFIQSMSEINLLSPFLLRGKSQDWRTHAVFFDRSLSTAATIKNRPLPQDLCWVLQDSY